MREWLGPDDPTVRQLLGKESPDQLAKRLITTIEAGRPAVRMALWKGGAKAVEAAHDPMIEIAKLVDERARAVRQKYEDEIEAVTRVASEKVAKARFAAFGTSVYPDATFTLRLSYGSVQGWTENGTKVRSLHHAGALLRTRHRRSRRSPCRRAGRKPKTSSTSTTRFNLSTNNDIIGGNSGSPLINAKGNIVGLVFDGNIHSISGRVLVRRKAEPNRRRTPGDHPRSPGEGLQREGRCCKNLQEPKT